MCRENSLKEKKKKDSFVKKVEVHDLAQFLVSTPPGGVEPKLCLFSS